MPTTNIHWVKLFLSLLDEDDRFLFQLNDSQQLLYVKLLMLSGRTYNQIVKHPKFICSKINYPHNEECFLKDIIRIMEVFPKFKGNAKYYYFENFGELHNQIQSDKWGIKQKEEAWKGVGLSQNGLSQIKNKIKNNIGDSPNGSPHRDKVLAILTKYKELKEFNKIPNNFYKRNYNAGKELAEQAGDEAGKVMEWWAKYSKKHGLDWTIETVIKKIPDYHKNKDKTPVWNDL